MHHHSALPVWLSILTLISCPSYIVYRSCVYRLLPEQPTRSVFLHAGASITPLVSAPGWHGIWCLLCPQHQRGPQDSGQCGFYPSFNNIVTLQYMLQSSRGQGMLYFVCGEKHFVVFFKWPITTRVIKIDVKLYFPLLLLLAWPWVPVGSL